MPIWLISLIPAFEAGFWSALLAGKIRNRTRVRELLIHGTRARTALPIIDRQLRKAAGIPTKSQAFLVRHIAKLIRWLANSKAIEHILLIGLKRSWPKGGSIHSKVRLCL